MVVGRVTCPAPAGWTQPRNGRMITKKTRLPNATQIDRRARVKALALNLVAVLGHPIAARRHHMLIHFMLQRIDDPAIIHHNHQVRLHDIYR